jgi:hypothetical protein
MMEVTVVPQCNIPRMPGRSCTEPRHAGLKVFDHAPVAMQQNQRRSCPPLVAVEANTFYRERVFPPEVVGIYRMRA